MHIHYGTAMTYYVVQVIFAGSLYLQGLPVSFGECQTQREEYTHLLVMLQQEGKLVAGNIITRCPKEEDTY